MTNKEITDEILVQQAVNGDQTAYSLLHERYRPKIEIYVKEIMSSNTEDTADIVQISMYKAFSNLDKFEPKYKFSTWLYNIAKNTAIDTLRREKANTERELFNTTTPLYKSPEDEYISSQSYSGIISRINSLDTKYKEIAKLRFIKELAYDEIAEITGLPINTIRTRIKRARLQLQDLDNYRENN